MPGLDSIQLKWPDDPSAVEQMRGFLSDLATCELVNDAFVDGVADDDDATGPQRPDLADTARARLRAWGADDDAVDRAFQIAAWCFREVLQPQLASLDLHVPTGFEDAASNALILGPELTVARDAWHVKYKLDERSAGPEWAYLEVVERGARLSKSVSFLPRRVSVRKYKPKPRWGDHPLDLCRSIASDCGMAFLYATQLQPRLAHALSRLGHPDFRTAGVQRRAREALHAAGITEFGQGLETLAVDVVEAYDRWTPTSASSVDVGAIAAATAPGGHRAVSLLVESPQLTDRPLPANASTFAAAAQDVLSRAVVEVIAHLHTQSAGR